MGLASDAYDAALENGTQEDETCPSCGGPCSKDVCGCNGCWKKFEDPAFNPGDDKDTELTTVWHDFGLRPTEDGHVIRQQAWMFEPHPGEQSVWTVEDVMLDGVGYLAKMVRRFPDPGARGEWYARSMVEDKEAGWTFLRHPYDKEKEAAMYPPPAPAPAVEFVDHEDGTYTIRGNRYKKVLTKEHPNESVSKSANAEARPGMFFVDRITYPGEVFEVTSEDGRTVKYIPSGRIKHYAGSFLWGVGYELMPIAAPSEVPVVAPAASAATIVIQQPVDAMGWAVGQRRRGPVMNYGRRAGVPMYRYGIGSSIAEPTHDYVVAKPHVYGDVVWDYREADGHRWNLLNDWPSILLDEAGKPIIPTYKAGERRVFAIPSNHENKKIAGKLLLLEVCSPGIEEMCVMAGQTKEGGPRKHLSVRMDTPSVVVAEDFLLPDGSRLSKIE